MNKIFAMIIVFSLITSSLVIPIAPMLGHVTTTTKELTSTRSILIVGTGQTYTNIQDAINAANSGDVIQILSGTYAQTVYIPKGKSLTLNGANASNTIIDGGGLVKSALTVNGDMCKVFNLTLKGGGPFGGNAGLFSNSSGNLFQYLVIKQNSADGVYFDKATYNQIKNCEITNNQASGISLNDSTNNIINDVDCGLNLHDGVYLNHSDNNLISRCDIVGNTFCGVSLKNSDFEMIYRTNCSQNHADGIYLMSSGSDHIADCDLYQNYLSGISTNASENNTLRNITSKNNKQNGFYLAHASNDNMLENCTLEGNVMDGAFLTESTRNSISISRFLSNGWSGLTLLRSKITTIETCAFLGNGVDGLHLLSSTNNQVLGTTVNDNERSGIYLKSSDLNTFQNCALDSLNDASMTLDDSDSNTITQNAFLKNSDNFAIQMAVGCSLNSITLNHFVNNRHGWTQAFDNGTANTWNGASKGNYWSDWTTPDANGDGIVDIPYRIEGAANATDLYPLTTLPGWPNIYTEDEQAAYENKPYAVEYLASDSDTAQNGLTWSATTNATWLTFTGQHVLMGTPKTKDIGRYWVNITVSDTTHEDYTNFTLEVFNVNDPPVISTVDVTSIEEDQTYKVTYKATDPDPTKDVLTWGLSTNASFLSMAASTGELYGKPENKDVGSYLISICVNDGKGGWAYHNYTLTVSNVNDAPFVDAKVGDFSFPEDTTDGRIDLNVWFKDVDSDLTFRCQGWKNITVSILSNGSVLLTPEPDWNGKETLTFFANDSVCEVSSSVTVTVMPVNDPPTSPTIDLENIEYLEGAYQPAHGNATDADLVYGDVLVFTWSNNRTGEIGKGRDINLSLPAGEYTITLNVTDKDGTWGTAQKQITILKPKQKEKDEKGFIENYWWLLLIIILAVVLILVIILFIVKKKNDKAKDDRLPEPTTTIPEPMPVYAPDGENIRDPAHLHPRHGQGYQQHYEPQPIVMPQPQQQPTLVEPAPLPEPVTAQPYQAIVEPPAQMQLPPEAQDPTNASKEALIQDLFGPLNAENERPQKRPAPHVVVKCFACNGEIPVDNDGPQVVTCPSCGTMSQVD